MHIGCPSPSTLACFALYLVTDRRLAGKGRAGRAGRPVFLVGDLGQPRLKILDFGLSLLRATDVRHARVTQAQDGALLDLAPPNGLTPARVPA